MQENHSQIISVERLEHAVKIAARVVALYGDIYLPTFNRLHQELMKAKEQGDRKSLALQLAMAYCEGNK